jgi:hypothetical protein
MQTLSRELPICRIKLGNYHNEDIVTLVTTKEPMMKITVKIDQFDNTFKTSQRPWSAVRNRKA